MNPGLRRIGWLLAGTVAAIGAGSASAEPLQTGACVTDFSAPRQPMSLTRELRRALGDGHEVITRRSYRVRFTRDGPGFRIDGELTGVEVIAPPLLEPIAQLERNRSDLGLFPILLDQRGVIFSQPDPASPSTPAIARTVVGTMIASATISASDKAETQRFVDALLGARGGIMTKWPTDLFRPLAPHRSSTSRFPLRDGQEGQVTVNLDADSDSGCGLVRSYERVVVTEFGGQQKVGRERWTLAPIRASVGP